MNFVALLLGLIIERSLTNLFGLREFRWFDPLIDRVTVHLGTASRARAMAGTIAYAFLCVLPVAFVSVLLFDTLANIPYFVLSVVVLLFSLGPRDLVSGGEEYTSAVKEGRTEDAARVVRELRETDLASDTGDAIDTVRRAVFIQANNRIFAVVFWFLLLGPTGAWLFRVIDLLRRRIAYEYLRHDPAEPPKSFYWAVRSVHGVLAWPSAHLLILAYALAGSFDGGLAAWREYAGQRASQFFVATNDLLHYVGNGASAAQTVPEGTPVAVVRVEEAVSLVNRSLLLIWAPIVALLTLTDWVT